MSKPRLAALTVALACAIAGGAAAPVASADHHFISVREVFPGSTTRGVNAEFIELQLYAPGQGNIAGGGQQVEIYGPTGGLQATYGSFAFDLTFDGNQRTFLLASSEAALSFGVSGDATLIPAVVGGFDPAGGAVCFTSLSFGTIDCATWGSFTPVAMTPPAADGGPPAVPGGIPDEQSLTRDISRGCATLLEGAYPPPTPGPDDVHNSSVDFVAATPTPRGNPTDPTEAPCSSGGGDTPVQTGTGTTTPAQATAPKKCKKGRKLKKGRCVKRKKKR